MSGTVERMTECSMGSKLRAGRAAMGWTLDTLARESGVSRSLCWELERDRRPAPSWTTVVRLARALGLSLDTLADIQSQV